MSVAMLVVTGGAASGQAQPTTTASATTTAPATTAPVASCEVADALLDAGRLAAAGKEYETVLRSDPGSACAREGLESVAPRPACALAEDLEVAGSEAKATKVLEDDLVVRSSDCATSQLADLNAPSLIDGLGEVVAGTAKVLGLVAAALALLSAVLLLFPAVRAMARSRLGVQLVFGPFTDSDTAKVAGPLTAATESAFVLLAETDGTGPGGGGRYRGSVNIVDVHSELSTAVEELGKVSSQLAPAAALVRLLERIVKPARWEVGGQVLAGDTTVGPGIAVTFDRGGSLRASTILRGLADPNDAAGKIPEHRYVELGAAVAAWTAHHLAAQGDQASSASMSTSAVSYAWLVAGARAQAHADVRAAVEYYERSLEADPTHDRARIGRAIARADLEEFADDFDIQIRLLEEALSSVDGRKVPKRRRVSAAPAAPSGRRGVTPEVDDVRNLLLEPDRLRLRYTYAAALVHRAAVTSEGGAGSALAPDPEVDLAAAIEQGWEIMAIAHDALLQVHSGLDQPLLAVLRAEGVVPPDHPPDRAEVRHRLDGVTDSAAAAVRVVLRDSLVPSTVVLVAGAIEEVERLRGTGSPSRVPRRLVATVGTSTNYRVAYNLACFHASSRASADGDDDATLRTALDFLAAALTDMPAPIRPVNANWVMRDPTLRRLCESPRLRREVELLVQMHGGEVVRREQGRRSVRDVVIAVLRAAVARVTRRVRPS